MALLANRGTEIPLGHVPPGPGPERSKRVYSDAATIRVHLQLRSEYRQQGQDGFPFPLALVPVLLGRAGKLMVHSGREKRPERCGSPSNVCC